MNIAMTAITEQPPESARRIEELGRIIMAYSEVTDRLQDSHERLRGTVAALREELGEKNRLLERRNRLAALGEMAAGLAHEIRNPLGGIQLYASLLAKDVEDRPDSLKIVGKIAAGVKRLEALVSHTLQFTREMSANLADCDLRAVIDQAVEMASATFAARRVACSIHGPESLPARADGLLMGQAMLNLLLNAAEAMDPGGTVTVTLAPDAAPGRRAAIVVQDDGPGLASDVLDRLFNPFFTTKDGGTGLGLAIVHRIVEAHDGVIRANTGPAGGARFEIGI